MDAITTPSLLDRLRQCAQLWVEADDKNTLARLGRSVINDGGFFENLDKRVKGPTTDTLEKFAQFMGEPANWPDGAVPDEAKAFAHVCGVAPGLSPATGCDGDSGRAGGPSAGKAGDASPETFAAPSGAGREASASLGSRPDRAAAVRPCGPAGREEAA